MTKMKNYETRGKRALWLGFAIAFLVTILPVNVKAGVAVNATNFPDPNFLHYLQWVMYNHNSEFGGVNPYKDDYYFSDEEIAKIKTINLSGRPAKVADLTGIQYFTSLTSLNVEGHELTKLDLSSNTALKKVFATNNHLTSVNIQGLNNLELLSVMGNNLDRDAMWNIVENLPYCNTWGTFRAYMQKSETEPDNNVITCLMTKRIKAKRWNVRRWDYTNNPGRNYDNSGNDVYVDYEGFKIRANDAFPDYWFRHYIQNQLYATNQSSYDAGLESGRWEWPEEAGYSNPFYNKVADNYYFTDDDFYYAKNMFLEAYNAANRGNDERLIYSLDGIKYFSELIWLNCNGHMLQSLDVSGMKKLRILRCHESEGVLTELNVTGCDSLYQLYCDGNKQLTHLDISTLSNLQFLRAHGSPIRSLDFSNTPEITQIEISNCRFSQLDVTKCPKLEILYCYSDRDNEVDGPQYAQRGLMTSLDLSKNTELRQLRISNQPIYNLDLSKNTKLELLYFNNVDLSNGNLQTNLQYLPNLERLSCYKDTLTSLDVSANTKLKELVVWGNNLKRIDLSKNVALTTLVLGENQVGEDERRVPLPNGGNPITSLDVSKNVNLEKLYCAKMQLTDLDLSALPNLTDLNYAEQTRRVQAELSENPGVTGMKSFYYLRMDRTADKSGLLLCDRLADTDNDGKSNFNIDLADEDSWTAGDIVSGRAAAHSRLNAVGTIDDLNPNSVVGKVLLLSDVTENGTEASGTTTYLYDVNLNSNVDPAVDQKTPFTLNWYAPQGVVTGVENVNAAAAEVLDVEYINAAGITAKQPWQGLNIVVTRYTDGRTTTAKVIK